MNKEQRAVYDKDYREHYGDLMKEQIKGWFIEHPDYLQKWRSAHPGYFDFWRQKNKSHLKEYKKSYMREYRTRLKLNSNIL
jgi:hypothetical protein